MRGCLRSRSERQPSRSEHSACPSPVHAEATDSRRERSACVTLHIKICLCLIRTERLMTTSAAGLPETLEGLRAAAEETRLRILALLAEGELSVSDLTDILGQSQPRISRHLKLLLEAIGSKPVRSLLDLGTGTGRMLQLLAPHATRAVGLDASHAMLSVARANLEKAGLTRVELRQGDVYAPPFARGSFDLVVIHQVLHYLDDPA